MKAIKKSTIVVLSVLASGLALAQTAPTTAVELAQSMDLSTATSGIWTAAGALAALLIVIFSARKILSFFRG